MAEKKASKKAAPEKAAEKKAEPAKEVKLTAFVKKQQQRLLDLRDELMDAMYGMQQETLKNSEGGEAAGSGEHTGDAGSDAYDREFALNLLAKEQDSLHEIEAALQRIEEGRYGICELSGEKIPQPRLEAIPFARLTVAKQSEWEAEHGNARFRPRDEYGFNA
ncbi:MAG: TraR/DksA family transcriptional regulator [Verrucomicrobiales bacterium]